MLEGPATYPLLRGRRQRRRLLRWRFSTRVLRVAGVALAALAVVGTIVLLATRAAAPDPRDELIRALSAFERGNYSAARNHALAAVAGPDAAAANAVLGRAYLALGEGVAAEGALTRAVAAGMPRSRLRHLFADAYLQQGDADRALGEVARYAPRYAAYAEHVRARALAANDDVPGATRVMSAALARYPRDAAGWADLGRIRFDAGDIAAADFAAQRAIAIDPRKPEGYVLRGEIVRSRYGLVAALPWFDRALTRDGYFHPALVDKAATLGDLGRNTDMLTVTRRALAARPGSAPALYLHAVLAARAGRIDLARAMLDRIGASGDDLPGVALLSGAIAYAGGQYQQAAAAWRDVVARQPMNLVARRLLGAALLRSGDARGALDVLRPIALRSDADSYTLTLVARAFEATGQRDWAARLLDRAARPASTIVRAFGSDAGAAVLANEMADSPGDPAAAVAFVRASLDTGDLAAAQAQARRIAAASPGAPTAQLLVGDVDAAAGRFAAAYGDYLRAADLRFDAPTLMRLAEAASRSGRGSAGSAALALYLAQNPRSIVARRALANLQLGARDWASAITTLNGLRADVGDRDAVVLAQLGLAYAGNGDPATARHYAAAAYALAPMNAAICASYANVLQSGGDAAAAGQLLAKAARLRTTLP